MTQEELARKYLHSAVRELGEALTLIGDLLNKPLAHNQAYARGFVPNKLKQVAARFTMIGDDLARLESMATGTESVRGPGTMDAPLVPASEKDFKARPSVPHGSGLASSGEA